MLPLHKIVVVHRSASATCDNLETEWQFLPHKLAAPDGNIFIYRREMDKTGREPSAAASSIGSKKPTDCRPSYARER